MKKIVFFLFLSFFSYAVTAQSVFLNSQKKHPRVVTAIQNKEQLIIKELQEKNIALKDLNILIAAYKYERQLEIFVKKKTATVYQSLKTYRVCKKSGKLGPKRKHRDSQVPEGFYYVDRFNPESSYHLSFGINYPNASDRKKSNAPNLGGSIFIHGACITIGCLPMTDDKIEEIHLYAKNNGQKEIPVYLFPFKMTDKKFNQVKKDYGYKTTLIDFWTNIKEGYDLFDKEKKELKIGVNSSGVHLRIAKIIQYSFNVLPIKIQFLKTLCSKVLNPYI